LLEDLLSGSTQVGKLLMEQCAGTAKKLSLELGGNAPFIGTLPHRYRAPARARASTGLLADA